MTPSTTFHEPVAHSTGSARVVAPYITAWSAEVEPPVTVVEVPGRGIGYADETMADRDSHGVLWYRTPFRLGQGRPVFGKVHPLRQRQTMRRLRCQVCAGPADHTSDGVLWLLKDHRGDWPGWPNAMGVTEPPVCLSCVRVSVRLCPALRQGAVAVRARRFPLSGVHGGLYAGGHTPVLVGDATVSYDNPAVRWVRAVSLARELRDCTIIEPDELPEPSPCPT